MSFDNGSFKESMNCLFFPKSGENLSLNNFTKTFAFVLMPFGTAFPIKNHKSILCSSPEGNRLKMLNGRVFLSNSILAISMLDNSPVALANGGAPKESCKALALISLALSNLVN